MVTPSGEEAPLVPGSGTTVEADRIIRFENVPIVTPNGDTLVKNLNFEVRSGMNVLVSGPNGFIHYFQIYFSKVVERVLFSEFLENYGLSLEVLL
jgi:hypothetical protein